MKKYLFVCLFVCFGSAQAALLGDTVHVAHNFSSLGSEWATPSDVTVVNGDSDKVTPHAPWYTADIDDTAVYVDYYGAATWTSSAFNGLVISQIDSLLTDFVIATNFVGWDDSRFSYANNSLMFNWSGLSFNADTYFTLTFNGGTPNAVPVPAAVFMFAPALLGFMGLRRRAKNALA